MNTFTAGSCLRFGWETFKKRSWFFVGCYLVFFVVVGAVTVVLNEFIVRYGIPAAIVGTLIRFAFQLLVSMGSIAFALKAHDDIAHVSLADFWHPFPFWKYVGTTVLLILIICGGLILLIIPGIIWGIMFRFSVYFVIDKKLGPIEALKESRRITNGYKLELFLLGILIALITILGLICFVVGLLVAIPVGTFAFVHAFRELQARSMSSAGNVAA